MFFKFQISFITLLGITYLKSQFAIASQSIETASSQQSLQAAIESAEVETVLEEP